MLDYQEMLLYIRLNRDKVSKLGYLKHYLPVRSKTGGRSPGMKMKQLRGPKRQSEIEDDHLLWIHREPPEGEATRRKILAKVVEIGINELFTTFIYTFGGNLYHQQSGAPIGTRVACAAANLLMEWVWSRMMDICRVSGKGYELWM